MHYEVEDGNSALNSMLLNAAVEKIVMKEVYDRKEQEVKERRERKNREMKSIVGFYEYFIDGIKNKDILHHNGEHYERSSVVVWECFGKYIKAYTPADMTFDEITKPFADKFYTFLDTLLAFGNFAIWQQKKV